MLFAIFSGAACARIDWSEGIFDPFSEAFSASKELFSGLGRLDSFMAVV
jgi:hypothetical protein